MTEFAKNPPWMHGKIEYHCAKCNEIVDRDDRKCPSCEAPLKKECPQCHYWVDLDVSFCLSCRYGFPSPTLRKGRVMRYDDNDMERPTLDTLDR